MKNWKNFRNKYYLQQVIAIMKEHRNEIKWHIMRGWKALNQNRDITNKMHPGNMFKM